MKKSIKLASVVLAITLLVSVASVLFVSAADTTFKPTIDGDYLYGIPADTTLSALKARLPSTIIEIRNTASEPIADSALIGTGYTALVNGNTYTIIILGDINGDGKIDSKDYAAIKRYYLGSLDITDENSLRAMFCTSQNPEVDPITYVKVKRTYLGSFNINEDYVIPLSEVDDEEDGWTKDYV